MSDERPDKCPTCGSNDPAEYASPCDRALYSDDRSDPFHRSHEGVPSRVGLHGNVVGNRGAAMSEQEARCEGGCGIEGPHDADEFCDPAPKPQGLDAVSGDGTWDEADERYAAAMSDERPDKCPTCGSDDPGKPGNDPANRGWELKVGIVPGAGWKPCPDLFHDDARLREVERELQKCKRRRESWKAQASKYRQRLDIAHTRCDAALSELARTKRQLNTLREALETICEIGETRDVEIARRALASLDEQEDK